MSDIWKGQTVIIKVLSRLGCCLCKQEAKMMSDMQPLFEEHDVRLIAIAFEDVDLHSFLSLGYWRWDIYLDPERKVYKAAGLKRASRLHQLSCLLSKHFMKLLSNLKSKGISNNFTGDLRQLGGTFVIDPDGKLIYDFRPNKMAHFPSLREIYALIGGDPNELNEDCDGIGQEYIYTRERLESTSSTRSISMFPSRSSNISSI
ncbi:hypothetical protein K502DRAFT_300423 [Neoconidiobolus thromboides FSU 785]|nr:hypothetical protein K502DRAFT_300423 [Neoconidiobolus thromboides FSU 785]